MTLPKDFWGKLWKINTLPRILQFLWRSCSKALPVKNALFFRHCAVNPLCPICLVEPETIEYLFFLCPWVRCVWFGCQLSVRLDLVAVQSFVSWLSNVVCYESELQDSDVAMLGWLLWFIWKERNEMVFNAKCPDPYAVITKARKAVNEFWDANMRINSDANVISEDRNLICWCAPPMDWLKLNCDGSFLNEDKSAGIGIVCRDYSGSFLWGFGEYVQVETAFMSELMAVRKAVMICVDLNLSKVIIETDNQDLVYCLQRKSLARCDWCGLQLLQETLDLAESRSDLLFSFSCREGNSAADSIAVSMRRKVCPPGWVSVPSLSTALCLSRDAASSGASSSNTSTVGGIHDREGIG